MSKENLAYTVVENFGDDFPACNVCGMAMASSADTMRTKSKTNYCKLCGMQTEGGSRSKFCCQSCEDKFEKFVKRRRRFEKWEKKRKGLYTA